MAVRFSKQNIRGLLVILSPLESSSPSNLLALQLFATLNEDKKFGALRDACENDPWILDHLFSVFFRVARMVANCFLCRSLSLAPCLVCSIPASSTCQLSQCFASIAKIRKLSAGSSARMTFDAVDTDVVLEWKMTDSIGNNRYHVIMIELDMSTQSDWFSLLFLDQIQAMPIYSLPVYLGL